MKGMSSPHSGWHIVFAKKIVTICLFALAVIFCNSCKSDDNEIIVGEWELIEVTPQYMWRDGKEIWTFSEDGHYTVKQDSYTGTGTYTLKKEKIKYGAVDYPYALRYNNHPERTACIFYDDKMKCKGVDITDQPIKIFRRISQD